MDWDTFFVDGIDICRPCGQYPGIGNSNGPIHTKEEDRSHVESGPSVFTLQEMLAPLDLSDAEQDAIIEERQAAAAVRHPTALDLEIEPEVQSDAAQLLLSHVNDALNEGLEAQHQDTISSEVASVIKKRQNSLWMQGKWVHLAACIRIALSPEFARFKQPKERAVRVREYIAPTVAPHLQPILEAALTVGGCIGTIVRRGDQSFAAMMRVVKIWRDGHEEYTVPRLLVAKPEARITMRGQILSFVNRKDTEEWEWDENVCHLRPAKGDGRDILDLAIHGCCTIPINAPEAGPNSQDTVVWVMTSGELSDLRDQLWTQIQLLHIAKLPVCGEETRNFPYTTSQGESHSAGN